MANLQEDLHLGERVERLNRLHSLDEDLDIKRLEQQYFLGEDHQGTVLEIVNKELRFPPIDPGLIGNRQEIIRILMGHDNLLGELDHIASGIIGSIGFSHEKAAFNGNLMLKLHRIVQYAHRLKGLLEKLPRVGDLSEICRQVEQEVRQTNLFGIVDDWERELRLPREAKFNLWDKDIIVDRTSHGIELRLDELGKKIDERYKPKFDEMLVPLDPFMKELANVLGFYIALAKYGVGLEKLSTSVVLPQIDDQIGYCDVREHYNPLLGGLRRNYSIIP